MYQILSRHEIPRDAWDEVVNESLDGWYYATYNWIEGISNIVEWGYEDQSFGFLKDNRLLAVVPLHLHPKNKTLSSGGWGWSGPVFREDSKKLKSAVFDHIQALSEKLNCNKIQLAVPPLVTRSLENNRSINPWIYYGYQDVSSHSQILDLTDMNESSLRSELSQTARYTVKNASHLIEVKKVKWIDHLESYYNLHQKTCERSNLSPHPFSYFKLIATIDEENHFLFSAFDKDNNIIAYHNDVVFKNKVAYHTAASSEYAFKDGSNYLLMWASICSALKNNCSHYELGEIHLNHPDPKIQQISFFKTRFGGELHRYFRGEKNFSYHPKMQATKNFLRSGKNLVKTLLYK